jgi:1-acyl-sn-glycerol-3-phosphate acyltransferase
VFYWLLKWVFLGPLLRLVFRPHTEGAENVPEEGPAILASNHLSYADWLFMPLTLTRRVTFVAKAEYFTGSGIKGWLQRSFFSGAGQVPIDRSSGGAAEGALLSAKRILAAGELFGIYPEGTRSRDGRLHKGHTGMARLALRTKAPIIPVGVKGSREIQPPDAPMPKPFTVCEINFGRPIDVTRYLENESDHLVLRQITDEVMFEIRELAGAEYVNEYATKKAETMPTEQAQIPTAIDLSEAANPPNGNGAGSPRSSADVLARRN